MKLLSSSLILCVLFFVFASCNKNDNNNTSLNSQDNYFLQQASYSNYAEINAGSIAAVRGSVDSVRMFGSMMVSDHGEAQSSLDSLGNKFTVALPTTPDSAHLAMADTLQTLSGHEFDTAYIGSQVRDHMTSIALFQQELAAGNNQEIKNYANKYLPIIEMHLQDAQNIQQQIQ
jgi:putative membrane protein